MAGLCFIHYVCTENTKLFLLHSSCLFWKSGRRKRKREEILILKNLGSMYHISLNSSKFFSENLSFTSKDSCLGNDFSIHLQKSETTIIHKGLFRGLKGKRHEVGIITIQKMESEREEYCSNTLWNGSFYSPFMHWYTGSSQIQQENPDC